MFENIMSKLGYRKRTDREMKILDVVNTAKDLEHDVFIDYLKTTKQQKMYVRKGKKTIMKIKLSE